MNKGLGIAALVIGVFSIIVPGVSLFVVWVALILATVAALSGDKTYSIATFVICLVNVLFLSPATMMAFAGERLSGGSSLKILTIILFLAPIAVLLISAVKRNAKSAVASHK